MAESTKNNENNENNENNINDDINNTITNDIYNIDEHILENIEIIPNQIVFNNQVTSNLNYNNFNEHEHEHEHEHDNCDCEHNHEYDCEDENMHIHEYDEDEGNDEQYEEQDNVIHMNEDMINQMDQQVNSKAQEFMEWAWENIFNVNVDILDKLNICYLQNLQYDDDEIDCVRYTVRNALNTIRDRDIKDVVQSLFYFGISGINVIFQKNYDLLNEIIKSELQLILRRSFMFIILNNLMNQQVNMEDVKMILSQEELNKLKSINFKDLDEKTKEINSSCTVCQDEFRENDKVRILSCNHVFHLDCIDPWLTQHSHKCPCCREPSGTPVANTSVNE